MVLILKLLFLTHESYNAAFHVRNSSLLFKFHLGVFHSYQVALSNLIYVLQSVLDSTRNFTKILAKFPKVPLKDLCVYF